jgi:hypothetical protein
MVNITDWPELPEVHENDPQADVKKVLYQARLDAMKAEYQADIEREKADWASEYVQVQAVNSAYLDAAKSSLERAISRANFVQTAATAISGVYVGALGVSFAVAQTRYLPARGIAPALFLGIAIFLVAIYTSFVTKPEDVKVASSDGTLPGWQQRRRDNFMLWTRAAILRRRHFLQASVISLGIGAFLLPLPYVDVPNRIAVYAVIVGLLLVSVPLCVAGTRSIISWGKTPKISS